MAKQLKERVQVGIDEEGNPWRNNARTTLFIRSSISFTYK